MARKQTQKQAMVDIIASALKHNTQAWRTANDIANEAMAQTGLRRAIWATQTPRQRNRIIIAAMAVKNKGKIDTAAPLPDAPTS